MRTLFSAEKRLIRYNSVAFKFLKEELNNFAHSLKVIKYHHQHKRRNYY